MVQSSGFVENNMEMTADRLNSLLIQEGTLSQRPQASKDFTNVVYIDINTSIWYQCRYFGSNIYTWVEVILIEPSGSIAGLRTIGNGPLQGSPGNHSHVYTITINENDNIGSGENLSSLLDNITIRPFMGTVSSRRITTTQETTIIVTGIAMAATDGILQLRQGGVILSTQSSSDRRNSMTAVIVNPSGTYTYSLFSPSNRNFYGAGIFVTAIYPGAL